jgi:hypothetical protein
VDGSRLRRLLIALPAIQQQEYRERENEKKNKPL